MQLSRKTIAASKLPNSLTRERLITPELKTMCEEDRAIIERVGTHYAMLTGTLDESASRLFSSARPDAGAFSAVPAQQKVKPARQSMGFLSLVAVVLVAALLLGSALWVVYVLHQSANLAAPPTMTPQLTQTHRLTPTPLTPAIASSGRVKQMVYDDKMNALLLFSGQDYTGAAPLDDTWIWNGSTWTQLHPAHRPAPCTAVALAYDPTTHQVVLYRSPLPQASARRGWNASPLPATRRLSWPRKPLRSSLDSLRGAFNQLSRRTAISCESSQEGFCRTR